jgi:hypothetical protein
MLNGTAFQRAPLAPLIRGIASLLLPTPVADGDRETDYAQGGRSLGADVRRRLPTPNAGDFKAGFSDVETREQYSLPRMVGRALGLSSGRRGKLSPEKVGWMMGFPPNWLKCLVAAGGTPSSHKSSSGSADR